MCFLSRADNNKISRKKPSEYKELLPADPTLSEILAAAVSTGKLFDDDFDAFLDERSHSLATLALEKVS
jgi:hypothetical protein